MKLRTGHLEARAVKVFGATDPAYALHVVKVCQDFKDKLEREVLSITSIFRVGR